MNKHYYSICINYRKNDLEQRMLLNIGRSGWIDGLKVEQFSKQHLTADTSLKDCAQLTRAYNETLTDELTLTETEIAVKQVGKVDAKKRLELESENLLTNNILESLATMLGTLVF